MAEKPGRLNSLGWESRRPKPLVGDEVDIEVFHAELSSKDVNDIMGNSPYPAGGLGLGASGRISAIGPDVKDFAVGDRVIGLGSDSLSSHLRTSQMLVEKIPDNVSFDEAATLPAAFGTALAALHNAGNLQAGQSVLIHNATGNVGLSALQLAKASRAEVYATVSTEAEATYLVENFNIPRTRIFWSTDDSFLEEMLNATGGEGVDVVLNSLSGDLLHATWKCVAEFGKMVEIGTADLLGAGKLDLNSFLGGRSYTGVNLEALMTKKRSVVKW